MSKPRYNSCYSMKYEELRDKTIMLPFSYENMVAVANLIEDVHREAKLPAAQRLAGYPIEEVTKTHQMLTYRMTAGIQSMEAMHESPQE